MNLLISDDGVVFLKTDPNMPSDYYGSKLCFQNYTGENQDTKKIFISEGNCLHYDSLQDIYTVPHDINISQRCFLLRLIIDVEELKRGNLPLHAAAVCNGSRVFLIAAPPRNGKSFLTHEICRQISDCEVIGDDHIVLAPIHVQGNRKRRMRNRDNETIGYAENKGFCKMYPITWICIAKQETDCEPVFLSGADAFKAFEEASAFKYLNETFTHNEIRYSTSAITDLKINEIYWNRFNVFLKESCVLFLRGTLNCIGGVISALIKRG